MFPADVGSGARTQPAPPPPPKTDTVQHGDTIQSVAERNGVTAPELAQANGLDELKPLDMGQVLTIPPQTAQEARDEPVPQTPSQRTDQAIKRYDDALKAKIEGMRDAPHNAGLRSEIEDAYDAEIATARQNLNVAVRQEIGSQVAAVPRDIGLSTPDLITGYGKAILGRHSGDAGATSAINDAIGDYRTQSAADAIAQTDVVGAHVTPLDRVNALKGALTGASPEVVSRVLEEPRVQAMLKDAAKWVADGYGGHQDNIADATRRLADLTQGLPPELATDLVQKCLPTLGEIAKIGYDGDNTRTVQAAYENLSNVVASMGHSGAAESLKSQIAQAYLGNEDVKYGGFPLNVLSVVGNDGADPGLSIAVTQALAASGKTDEARDMMKATLGGIETYKNKVAADEQDFAEKSAELTWFAKNLGSAMTPQQREQAIKDYISSKGPDWQKDYQAAGQRLSDDGSRLIKMLGQLSDLPDDVRSLAPGIDDKLPSYLNDGTIKGAMEYAADRNPGVLDTEEGENLLSYIGEKVEQGNVGIRELGAHLAQQKLTSTLLGKLDHFNPKDPASINAVKQELENLQGSRWLNLIGVNGPEGAENFEKAAGILETFLENPGDSQALTTARLNSLNANLGKIEGFGDGSTAGMIFRLVGASAASVAFVGAGSKALTDPSVQNTLSAFSSGAGLTSYGVDLGRSIGVLSPEALVAGGPATVVLSTAAAVSDLVNSGVGFSSGDPVQGVLSGLRGASTFALFAAEAPEITIPAAIIWGATTLGLGWHDHVEEANRYEPGNDDKTVPFLEHAGFSPDAAAALANQSGDGYSPVSILSKYAEDKGYDLGDPVQQKAFANWVNGLSPQTLSTVRDALHRSLDDFGGDAGKLGTDSGISVQYDVNPSTGAATPYTPVTEPKTVGDIDSVLIANGGTPLPSS